MQRHALFALTAAGALLLAGACGSVTSKSDGGETGGAGGHVGTGGDAGGHVGTGGSTAGSGGAGAGGTAGIVGSGGVGTGGAAGAVSGTGGTAGVVGTGGVGSGGTGGTTPRTGGIAGAGSGGSAGSVGGPYTLTVTKAGAGAGSVASVPAGINCGATCTAQFGGGTSVTLTATPSTGSTFASWSGGGCSGNLTCVVDLTAAASVTATFTLNQETLTVTKSGTGAGAVSSTPTGISCGATCSVGFAYGTSVTLTPTAAVNSAFASWSGGGCSGTGSCVVSMTTAIGVTATFNSTVPTPLLYYTLDTSGAQTGSVAGYPLTLSGNVTFGTGKISGAALFGPGSYGLVQGSARAVLGAYPQYTISFWINATAPSTTNAFLDFNNRGTAPYGGLQFSYLSPTLFSLCASTTTNSYLTGSCPVFAAPATGAWHNVIIRYAGTGTGAGQGAPVQVYEDDVLTTTIANDAANNPVFNPGISDTLFIGTTGMSLDDVRIYNSTFSQGDQCTVIIGGTWTGSACTLP
jgi:Divergent InlB B-repeat domain